MAVKPVTNAHAPNLTDINRAEQVSFKNVKPRETDHRQLFRVKILLKTMRSTLKISIPRLSIM